MRINRNNLLVIFEGNDKQGRNKLLNTFAESYSDKYFVFEFNLIRNLTTATLTNNIFKKHYIKKIMKMYRRHFDIIVVNVSYRGINIKDPYYQYALEVSGNEEKIAHDAVETFTTQDTRNLIYFKNIHSLKKCEIIPYSVDFDGNVDYKAMADNLKKMIDEIINKKGK